MLLNVLTNLEEVMPYMEQFLHEFWRRSRDPTPQEYDTLLRKGAKNGLPDFISWSNVRYVLSLSKRSVYELNLVSFNLRILASPKRSVYECRVKTSSQ
jgi:hypothetical protein